MEITNLANNPRHIETVSKWIYEEFIENIRLGIDYERVVENFSKSSNTFIAVHNGICIGTASLLSNDLKERKDLTPWLGALYVSENNRNKGVAKKLIKKVIEIAKDTNYDKIYLRTEHASEYYIRLGWEFIYETVDEFGLNTQVFMKHI